MGNFKGKIVAIIPARGGSKRIPQKNIRLLGGFPLIQYSIALAMDCDWVDQTFVSTDDPAIAEVALQAGAQVLARPENLAGDFTTTLEVLLDVYENLKQSENPPRYFLLLQPTSPLRTKAMLQEGYDVFQSSPGSSAVIGVKEGVGFSGSIEQGIFKSAYQEKEQSQTLAKQVEVTGSFYLLDCVQTLEQQTFLGDRCVPFITTDSDFTVDIDNFEEFAEAERGLASGLKKYEDLIHWGRHHFIKRRTSKNFRIAAITTARSDFGLMEPVYRHLGSKKEINFELVVTGSHFFERTGNTIDEIRNSAVPIFHEIPVKDPGVDAKNLADLSGDLALQFGQFFSEHSYDLVLILGDRFEYLPILNAGLLFNQPFGHVHGGEITQGAIDDSIRHCLTKLSHLHFVANEEFGRRVAFLGEELWRIFISGSPAIDGLMNFTPKSRGNFFREVGLRDGDFVLVTLHPETIGVEDFVKCLDPFFEALARIDQKVKMQWLFTAPAPDTKGDQILASIQEFQKKRENVFLRHHLGRENYLNALHYAQAMLGNSSSGMIEAPSFGIPVINIGERQKGRPAAENTFSVPFQVEQIEKAFFSGLGGGRKPCHNPYGEGKAAEVIFQAIREMPPHDVMVRKKFCDLKS